MATRAEARQIMEQQTMGSDARLRQDNFARREERSNWTSAGLLVMTILVLAMATYIWYSGSYAIGNSIKPANNFTMMQNTDTAPQPHNY